VVVRPPDSESAAAREGSRGLALDEQREQRRRVKPLHSFLKRPPPEACTPAAEGPTDELAGEGLVKAYARRRAVDGVSIGLSRGEIVGLLGPNGAGKTTSFYMVVGLIRADAGRVLVDGRDVTRAPMHARARLGVGYLAQGTSIFRKLSVWNNVMGILELQGLTKAERLEECERLLERLNVLHLRHYLGEALSGGESRRVEIARCLASRPSFILLDEPFTGVDPKAIRDIQDIIRQLREDGIGILITDHSFRETLEITDRAYIIFDGKIHAQGTPEQLVHDEAAQRYYFGDALTRGFQVTRTNRT